MNAPSQLKLPQNLTDELTAGLLGAAASMAQITAVIRANITARLSAPLTFDVITDFDPVLKRLDVFIYGADDQLASLLDQLQPPAKSIGSGQFYEYIKNNCSEGLVDTIVPLVARKDLLKRGLVSVCSPDGFLSSITQALFSLALPSAADVIVLAPQKLWAELGQAICDLDPTRFNGLSKRRVMFDDKTVIFLTEFGLRGMSPDYFIFVDPYFEPASAMPGYDPMQPLTESKLASFENLVAAQEMAHVMATLMIDPIQERVA